jgi:hypothetical protein
MYPKFPLGAIVATPGALEAIFCAGKCPMDYVERHLAGDWGELDADDRQANDRALIEGTRLFSAYVLPSSEKIWIITEADRSATTLLLPEEY